MKYFFASILLIALNCSLWANLPDKVQPVFHPSVDIAKTTADIKIDGDLNDPGWQTAKRIGHFTERYPGENTPADVQTEVRITYDENKLYVAYNCTDDPKDVRATMAQRDQFSGDDAVVFLLDTYGDASWAYEFYVNPYGVQKDYLWSSISGEDPGYDLIWESSAKKTATGYQVEMAIPFKSLRFPDKDVQTWKIDFWRNRPRESSKTYSWAAYDRNEQCWPCQWGTMNGITGVQPGKGIEILPAMVAHQSGALANRYNPNSTFTNQKAKGELSVGGKYSVTSDITAEVAYNPDFSQIEADAAQIDVNSTISLQYPERRPFFQEGSDIFRTMFNSFYTRTVNDPQFTAKLTGRMGSTSIAYLMAKDDNTPYIIPLDEMNLMVNSGNSFINVLRTIHTIGEDSRVGVMIGDRRFEKKGYGTILSLDGDIRLSSNYSWLGQFIQTYSKEPFDTSLTRRFTGLNFGRDKYSVAFDGESFNGSAFITELRRNSRELNFVFDYNQIHPLYRTEIGYDPVVNHRTASTGVWYNIYPTNSIFTQITPQAFVLGRWSFDGMRKIERVNLSCSANLNVAQTSLSVNYNKGSESFNGVMFDNLWGTDLFIYSRVNQMLGFNISASYGQGIAYFAMAKGNETGISATVNIKPIDMLTLDQTFYYSRSTAVESGEEYFNGYISRTKLQFQVSREFSLRFITQYNYFSKLWEFDPLLTYRLSPFSVVYLGSTTDFQYFSPTQQNPSLWKTSARQYFMKLQYLFQI